MTSKSASASVPQLSDLRVAVVGNVDAGKSTLIGTLQSGTPDNGRGLNRIRVMNFDHEIQSGRTSSIAYQIVGFDDNNQIIPDTSRSKRESWRSIMANSSKIITFIDLAGHERYLKTTICGISSNHPDYILILIEGKGIRGMTREHLMLALSYGIPFAIVVTKTDLYDDSTISETTESIKSMISRTHRNYIVCDGSTAMPKSFNKKLIPILYANSCKTDGLDILRGFLGNLITAREHEIAQIQDSTISEPPPFEMSVLEIFKVKGVGCVAHCFLKHGCIHTGDECVVGPDRNGKFVVTKIKSIQYKRLDVSFCMEGNHVCVALKSTNYNNIRKGMSVLSTEIDYKSMIHDKLIADITVAASHSTTIKCGYEAVLNIGNVKVTGKFIKINGSEDAVIRGGSKAVVELQMLKPIYIRKSENVRFLFREGRTRGWGTLSASLSAV